MNERAHLLGAPTWALVDAGRMDQAAVLVEEALGQGPTDPAVVACLFQTRALAAYRADRLGAMRSDLDAVDEFSADRLPLEVSIRQSFLWKAYWSESGDHEKAKWWAERGLHLAEESGDPIRILDGKRRLALARARGGDLRGARDMLRDAYDLARGIGYVAPLVGSGVNLLVALSFAGDLPSGLALGAELLPVVSSPYWRSLTLETLAGMEFEAGRSGVARAHVRESLDIAEQSGQRERYLRSLLRLASMQIMEGETKSAGQPAIGGADRTWGSRGGLLVACRRALLAGATPVGGRGFD
ncbi:MAG: hypothetical protein E6G40_10715 [Actinobacteria bacterium]|nr:MAG: hypothetical protein E6G40_10715 [Actinomycetota bacterium]